MMVAKRTYSISAWSLTIAVSILPFSVGCRSGKHSIHHARTAYSAGDLETAASTLAALSEEDRSLHLPSELDLAMVEFAAGEPAAAESRLRDLRDHFDRNPPQLTAADAVSLATDDNARPFSLAQYELVLLRSLLAACSLAGDGVDAEAYCLQAHAIEKEFDRLNGESEEKTAYENRVALAPYLRGVIREATHQDYDDAQRAFRLVSAIRPEFRAAEQDIERVVDGTHSRAGHGVVYVFALTGNGPRLVETVAPTTTASLQIASVLLRSIHNDEQGDDDEPVLPNVASVKVPDVVIPASAVARIGVMSQGQPLGVTQTLTDIGQLAVEASHAEMPKTIARAVVRRVLKEASVTATSDSLGLHGDAAAAFKFAAINAWSATENADTRCWSLLPREIQVLRVELPVGEQMIELVPVGNDGFSLAPPVTERIEVEDGRNHYCFVVAPETIVSVVQ